MSKFKISLHMEQLDDNGKLVDGGVKEWTFPEHPPRALVQLVMFFCANLTRFSSNSEPTTNNIYHLNDYR